MRRAIPNVQFARGLPALGAGRSAEAYDHLRRFFDPTDLAYHLYVRFWALGDLFDLVEAAQQSDHLEEARTVLARLLQPLRDACAQIKGNTALKRFSVVLLLRTCQRLRSSFWAWDEATWVQVLGDSLSAFCAIHGRTGAEELRQHTIALAYILGCFRNVTALKGVETEALAKACLATLRALCPAAILSRAAHRSRT